MKRIFAALMFLAAAAPASAQVLCVPNKVLRDMLKTTFDQVPAITAMRNDDLPLMVFANPETGMFTMVIVGPEASCIMFTGTDLEIFAPGDPA